MTDAAQPPLDQRDDLGEVQPATDDPTVSTLGTAPVDEPAITPAPPAEPILQFFAYDHLPVHLMEASAPFCHLARDIVAKYPRNPERTVGLRKLLEAKDAIVRALIYKDQGWSR